MAKVGVIYIADTKHALACFTTAGELDAKTKVADAVGSGLTLRAQKGAGGRVSFPSANDALKLAVPNIAADALAALLAAPAAQSVPDDKTPAPTPGVLTLSTVTLPATQITFTFGTPGRSLKCVLAHQRGAPGDDNPASLITDVINPADTSKTINVDYRAGDFIALFVEGFLPIVQ